MRIYAAHFLLNNEVNAMKTDSGEKAAVKKATDYSEVDVCTNSAVRYASKVQSRYVYLYSSG